MFTRSLKINKSIYPLIGILSTALSGAFGFTFYKIYKSPDVQLSKFKRQAIIRQ